MFEQFQWAKISKDNFIELYSSHKLNDINKPILFVGGMHGDEPEGVNLAINLLAHLKNFPSPEHWALITCLNPDGHQTQERTNGNGVDLNRNFPSPDWSNSYEKQRYYPGLAPNSEEETKALTQLIINIQPRIIVHFHSWKPSIILTGPKDNTEANLFSKASNYPLELDIGYPTPGSLGQYAWLTHNIPVICIEEAEGEESNTSWDRFKPAFESILNINK